MEKYKTRRPIFSYGSSQPTQIRTKKVRIKKKLVTPKVTPKVKRKTTKRKTTKRKSTQKKAKPTVKRKAQIKYTAAKPTKRQDRYGTGDFGFIHEFG